MKIRESTLEDMENVAKCLSALGSTDFSGRQWASKLYFDLREGCKVQTFVAVDDNDVPIGTATLFLEPKLLYAGTWGGHIEDVSVREDQQGKGVGRALIEHLVDLCKSRYGCYKIVLNCAFDKVGFYEKMGFYQSQTAYMRMDLRQSETPLLTEKELIGRMVKGDIEAVYHLEDIIKNDQHPYRRERYEYCLRNYKPDQLIKEVLVYVLDACPKCGSKNTTLHNYSAIWHDGDVICDDCGTYVRAYDAG